MHKVAADIYNLQYTAMEQFSAPELSWNPL